MSSSLAVSLLTLVSTLVWASAVLTDSSAHVAFKALAGVSVLAAITLVRSSLCESTSRSSPKFMSHARLSDAYVRAESLRTAPQYGYRSQHVRMNVEADADDFDMDGLVEEASSTPGKKTGFVKWFNPVKGYGFITPDDDSGDTFVHYSGINDNGFKSLAVNEPVEFILATDPKNGKKFADQVTGPNGAPVQGAPRPTFYNDGPGGGGGGGGGNYGGDDYGDNYGNNY